MKNAVVIFLLICLAGLCTCLHDDPEKTAAMYLNLDFEDHAINGRLKIWMTGGNGYTASVDEGVFYTGKSSLCLKKTAVVPGFGVATSTFPVDQARGKTIRFAGYIKTESVENGFAGLWWRADLPDQKIGAFDNMQDRGPRNTTDWAEYVIELEIPEETVNINFGAILPGTGTAWFDNLTIEIDGHPYKQIRPLPVVPKKADLAWIRKQAVPIATVDPSQGHSDLEPLRHMIGRSRIVALGEGTHGTSEFFKMKHRIVRYLAEEMGFTVFAIEANMPEARAVNRYVLTGEGDPKAALSGLYFWTWDTQEVLDMIEWMRDFNRSGRGRIEFLGFDMQFPDVAMAQVEYFIKVWDPGYLKEMQRLYGEVRGVQESIRGQQNQRATEISKWHTAASAVYAHLHERQEQYAAAAGDRETAWAVQDAQVVVQAAEANLPGKRSRDESMAENLTWILDHRPLGTKVVTWAHNLHVTRGYDTYRSMGYYLERSFKEEHVVFGFAFHTGRYTAVGPQGIRAYGTSASEPGSVEWFFKQSGAAPFILDLRLAGEAKKGAGWLFREMDFRNIGAMASDYAFSPHRVLEEFDVLIFFENTTASDCFRTLSIH